MQTHSRPLASNAKATGFCRSGKSCSDANKLICVAFGQRELLLGLGRRVSEITLSFATCRVRIADVRLDLRILARVAIVDRRRHLLALRDRPNPLVAVGDHLPQLGELDGEIDDAERVLPPAIDIEAVDRAVVVKELQVLLVDFRPEFLEIDLRRRPRAEQRRRRSLPRPARRHARSDECR